MAQGEEEEAEMGTPTLPPASPCIQVSDVPAHLSLAINSCQKLINPSITCNHNNLAVGFIPIL